MKGYIFLTTGNQSIQLLGISDEHKYEQVKRHCFDRNNYQEPKIFEFTDPGFQEALVAWFLEEGVPYERINSLGAELYEKINHEIHKDCE